MANINVPYSDAGAASFEQLYTWLQTWLFGGLDPAPRSFPFAVDENQTLVLGQVVGLNARNKIVPATLASTTTSYYVANAAIVAGGTGGTNGAQTVTGTTGTGTKFQAGVTVAGGIITAITSILVDGAYSVAPTVPTVEPVTGGGLTGATLALTIESAVVPTAGVQATGVMTQNLTTPVGVDTITCPIWYQGSFSIRGLTWDPSFTTDAEMFAAFRGAPTPTNIIVVKRQSDL
jgi:hypothetical protein